MQPLRTYRNPRRTISIEALLVWTFRAQRAELEPPRDLDRDRARRRRVDHLPARRRAWLHGRLLAPCAKGPGREDAETVAAVVVGALDWHIATRVAELARAAGARPDPGPVRCPAAGSHENPAWPLADRCARAAR